MLRAQIRPWGNETTVEVKKNIIVFVLLTFWTFFRLSSTLGTSYQSFTETCLWRSVRSVEGTCEPNRPKRVWFLLLWSCCHQNKLLSFTEFHVQFRGALVFKSTERAAGTWAIKYAARRFIHCSLPPEFTLKPRSLSSCRNVPSVCKPFIDDRGSLLIKHSSKYSFGKPKGWRQQLRGQEACSSWKTRLLRTKASEMALFVPCPL